MSFAIHRTWAEIDLEAIRENARRMLSKALPDSKLIAIVKANAYGHGAREVTRSLEGIASAFAVATFDEAEEISPSRKPIILLSPCLPGERQPAIERGLIPTVSSLAEAEAYAAFGERTRIHLKIDTGMGRLGVPLNEARGTLAAIRDLRNVEIHSISTHLPSADEDPNFTLTQLEQFESFRAESGIPASQVHVLNSAGVLAYPCLPGAFVRVGIALYGVSPLKDFRSLLDPALAWKTRVVLTRVLPADWGVSYGRRYRTVKPTKVAILAVGYADGFPRQASGRGSDVLIGGVRRPVLGNVTMDQVIVDVSQFPQVEVGDEAVLIGKQGEEEILATELADRSGTIPWDILAGIGHRVERVYRDREPSASAAPM